MSSEPVVELLLVAIETGVGSGQTVHLPSQTVLERERERENIELLFESKPR